jgi:hypothetical protein
MNAYLSVLKAHLNILKSLGHRQPAQAPGKTRHVGKGGITFAVKLCNLELGWHEHHSSTP